MALLLKDTMDSSIGGYDCPIWGYWESDPLPPFENDACHSVNLFEVLEPATVHTSTTDNFGFDHVNIGQDPVCTGLHLKSNNFLGFNMQAYDLTSFDGNAAFDLESLVAETPLPQSVQLDPRPATSTSTSTISDLTGFSFSSLKMTCESSAPGSPDSGFYSVESPSSTGTSDDEPSQCATMPTVKVHGIPDLHVSAEDIQYLEQLLEESGDSDVQSLHTPLSLSPVDFESCTKLPIKNTSRNSPKTTKRLNKSLTKAEKKERKRAQNKNAATRYREKKRAEAKVVFDAQSEMEDKNRDLKDKVTLLTREIQYMKELLIEVYKTKGLVE